MLTKKFKDKELGLLGFGTMRMPQLENGQVDEELVNQMVDVAMQNGINYFDTAYPYHGSTAETAIGKVLKKYPRESFYLATKYPGHQIASSYNPAEIFEEQLKKCQVDYFDFYLLHNVYENSIQQYTDPRWGIIEYFKEQKRLGRIKHLGFSTHAAVPCLKEFIDAYGDDMEFCQIQLNYLDWTLQDAKTKYEILTEKDIAVFVMEPVRGGRLVQLSDEETRLLKEKRPNDSVASWGFRFLQALPNVKMILSGMSNMEQLMDNITTFKTANPLTDEEKKLLFEIAEGMKNNVPCTACRYCCDGCPMGLDIPMLLSCYNELRFSPAINIAMRLEALPQDKQPSACIKCGKCARVCPQNINIPEMLKDMTNILSKIPSWVEICKQREEAAKNNKV